MLDIIDSASDEFFIPLALAGDSPLVHERLPQTLPSIDEPITNLLLCNTSCLGKPELFLFGWVRIVYMFRSEHPLFQHGYCLLPKTPTLWPGL